MQAVVDPKQTPGLEDFGSGNKSSGNGRGSVASVGNAYRRRERDLDTEESQDAKHLLVHWLCSEEVENAVAYRDRLEEKLVKKKRKSATSIRKSKKLRDTIRDYPDMLFCITPDGSVAIWGVQVFIWP
jgi:hypothetical protein